MTDEERTQLNMLLEWKRQMEAANTIPLPHDQAIRGRFFTGPVTGSTTQTLVVGAGGGSFTIPAQPSATVTLIINGQPRKIPYFT